jgi:hypothetical protein
MQFLTASPVAGTLTAYNNLRLLAVTRHALAVRCVTLPAFPVNYAHGKKCLIRRRASYDFETKVERETRKKNHLISKTYLITVTFVQLHADK